MTVKEQIQFFRQEGVKYIKLGSGAGFVWCGSTAGKTIQTIGMVSGKTRTNTENELKRRKDFLANYESFRKSTIAKWMNKRVENWLENNDSRPAPEQFMKWWNDAETDCEKQRVLALGRIETLMDRLDNWVEFQNRAVKVVYPSQTEPNCMIVIMDGDETGQYWTLEEYQTGKVPRDWEEI